MTSERKNKNRGYQQLLVWQDAIELFGITFRVVRGWPFEQKKLVSQALASSDSVHRNIAEGYCRRTIREYLQHLNVALGSLGESLSGFIAYSKNGQIGTSDFEQIDVVVFRLENRLLKLVESLERKRDAGSWTESLIVREVTPEYGGNSALTHDLRLFEANLAPGDGVME